MDEKLILEKILESIGLSKSTYISQMELKGFASFKDWLKRNFEKQELEDMVNHGCVGGFHDLTYYSETTAIYRNFNNEFWEMLISDAESLGAKNVLELIATFNGANDVGSAEQFENLVVWYAAERVAQELLDELS